jgi:hypothetical protein
MSRWRTCGGSREVSRSIVLDRRRTALWHSCIAHFCRKIPQIPAISPHFSSIFASPVQNAQILGVIQIARYRAV